MRLRKHLGVLVLFIFGGAAVLRIGLTHRQTPWADELFSLAIATGHSLEHPAREARPELGDYVERPEPVAATFYQRYLKHDDPPAGPGRVVRAVQLSDSSPPLYYLLLNAWTRAWGTSDASLHGFSVLWSLACFPLLWWLGRQVGGRVTAWLACLLFAAAPVSTYYATEGRMYSLLWFLTLALIWLTVRLHGRGLRWHLWGLWILAAAAGLLTHYFFAFVWLACLSWLIFSRGRFARAGVVAGAGLTGLIVLPWYARLPDSIARWRVTGDWLNGFPPWPTALATPFSLAWSFLSGNGYWGESDWGEWLAMIAFALVGWQLLRWEWRGARSSASRHRRLLYLWLLAACTGPLVFDGLRNTSAATIPRYALAGMPAAFLLAGLGLSKFRGPVRAALVALILLAWLPGTWTILHLHARCGEPYQALAYSIEDLRAEDLVLVHTIPSGVAGVARYLPPKAAMASWVEQLKGRRVPEDLETLIAGRRRVVLIKIHEVGAPAPEEDWLRENADLIREEGRGSAQILYFAPRNGERFAANPKSNPPEG